jgi:hypothetical protein
MNVDMVQLGNHASSLTEFVIILSQHLEWNCELQRLQLLVITKDSGEIRMKADHINAASWQCKVDVASINLHTY